MNLTPEKGECKRCGALTLDKRFCGCGAPTDIASFDERSKWEAEQWRAYKATG